MQQQPLKVKAYDLRKQEEDNLVIQLNRFRQELVSLRTSKVSSAPQVKLARIRVGTSTARLNTLKWTGVSCPRWYCQDKTLFWHMQTQFQLPCQSPVKSCQCLLVVSNFRSLRVSRQLEYAANGVLTSCNFYFIGYQKGHCQVLDRHQRKKENCCQGTPWQEEVPTKRSQMEELHPSFQKRS